MTNFKRRQLRLYMLFIFLGQFAIAQSSKLTVEGLEGEVEIIVDKWGIPHIYASTEADLFFAQGYYAAKDRLFQFEIWRRQATGTVAEILGERELQRDMGTRLFKFRGDIQQEMQHYHPHGALIITSFVKGVNAYIASTHANPELLPVEFKLLGITPQFWTPEIVISRHQGLLGNIGSELENGRLVAAIGSKRVLELGNFQPGTPLLELDPKIDPQLLNDDILGIYTAFRRPIRFQPEDLTSDARNSNAEAYGKLALTEAKEWEILQENEDRSIGSNNWVISGAHSFSGYPMMANDPHRAQSTPSLRYMSHLVGPGWDVIGGGEPEIPGISIGHNQYGAWGLTVFATDAEDLYVYKTNPQDPNRYWYKGNWEPMLILKDTILVKNKQPVVVELKYTRHGPVVFENQGKNAAFAMRCGWMEIGGSPYLASLRMNQAHDFESFREACAYSHIPGENMVWADKAGNIGWQAVGIAPIRRNWSGLVPVPGDGSYEWEGYLPIKAKPHLFNPASGIIATANEQVTPLDYPYMDAIGFEWSDPFRGHRVREVLTSGRKHTIMDFAGLQTDYLSIPARNLCYLLKHLSPQNERQRKALEYLNNWDFKLEPHSIAAAIYNQWEGILRQNMEKVLLEEKVQPLISLQLSKVIEWLCLPDGKFGADPIGGRDKFLLDALEETLSGLSIKLGPDMEKWQYGQLKYKHVYIRHPLSNAVNENWRKKLDAGPAPRGGNSSTANSTGGGDNQLSGASFRIIVDTGDWDRTLGTNTPGQAGDPDDKHYKDLFDLWAKDKYFPVFYSRPKVESVLDEKIILQPQ